MDTDTDTDTDTIQTSSAEHVSPSGGRTCGGDRSGDDACLVSPELRKNFVAHPVYDRGAAHLDGSSRSADSSRQGRDRSRRGGEARQTGGRGVTFQVGNEQVDPFSDDLLVTE
jgi:hypothetical protein